MDVRGIGSIEAKLGPPSKPLPVAFDRLKIEVGKGASRRRLSLDEVTVADIKWATRAVRVTEDAGLASFLRVPLAARSVFASTRARAKLPSRARRDLVCIRVCGERALDKDLRIARAGGRAELERAIEHAEQMLAELRRMHDFVRAFRDGKIDWKTFVAGPPTELGGDDIDDLLDDLDIAAALDVLLGSAPRRRRSRR